MFFLLLIIASRVLVGQARSHSYSKSFHGVPVEDFSEYYTEVSGI